MIGGVVIAIWRSKIEERQKISVEKNKIIWRNAVEKLKGFDDSSIDLTVFSPPYDGLRNYNGYDFNMRNLGYCLYRVMKEGGVVAVVMQDQTTKGKKTLTTFRTAIDWCDNIGFNLFECNIYQKNGKDGAWWARRFRVDHEYILIFVKGKKPKFFNKEPLKIPSKHAGKYMKGGANREKNGITQESSAMIINSTKCPALYGILPTEETSAIKKKAPCDIS